MHRVGTYTVQFRELRPYVFCDGYKVPKGPTGKYELKFSNPDGKSLSASLTAYSRWLTVRLDVKDLIEGFHRIGLH